MDLLPLHSLCMPWYILLFEELSLGKVSTYFAMHQLLLSKVGFQIILVLGAANISGDLDDVK